MAYQYIGSSFEDFLEREGLLEECKEAAAKRVLVWQLEKEMQKQHLNKEEFTQKTSRTAVIGF